MSAVTPVCPDCLGYGFVLVMLVEDESETPIGADPCPTCHGGHR